MQTTTRRKHQTVELGRYVTARGEERLLVARRGDDNVVRVFDIPNAGDRHRGPSYLVEAGFESKAELAIFRRRYLEDAESLGDSPTRRRSTGSSPSIPRRGDDRSVHHPHGPRLYVAGLRIHHGSAGCALALVGLVRRDLLLAAAGVAMVVDDLADFPWRDCDNHGR